MDSVGEQIHVELAQVHSKVYFVSIKIVMLYVNFECDV